MLSTTYKYYLIVLLGFCNTVLLAQNTSLQGQVVETPNNSNSDDLAPVVGANIYWANTTQGTTTDVEGNFSIERSTVSNLLIISFIGQSDTIPIEAHENDLLFTFAPIIDLDAVEIEANQPSTYISMLEPAKSEVITTEELCKAACCNLSESFETNATVDVSVSDGVSGAKKIKMLGLDGVYSQLMTENIPSIRGLATTYGLGYVPGTWIESVQINKGTGSVVNGYESMTGQINVEYFKPRTADKLFLNLFVNQMGRTEINLNIAHRFKNSDWSGMLFLHGSNFSTKLDHNEDSFLDVPQLRVANVINRWQYNGKRLKTQIGVKAIIEDRLGGQLSYDKTQERTADNGYGIGVTTKRLEYWTKTGIIFEPSFKSLAFITSGTYHQQNSFFGLKNYSGTQKSWYFNMIYQTQIAAAPEHVLKTGLSYIYDDYNETFNETPYLRTEHVPGAFAEYTYAPKNFAAVLGLRTDYHNLYGWQFNPRLHVKYNIKDNTSVRASIGRGFRVANIFAENTNIFASARNITIAEALLPEIAWNAGVNATHQFTWFNRNGHVSIDAYRTQFSNQIIADVFSDNQSIVFYNLNGESFANSVQIETLYEIVKDLNLKLAYKFDDVKATYGTQLINLPLQSRHKALANISYTTPNERWMFDFTTQWHGPKTLLNTLNNGSSILIDTSPSHFIFNTQITHKYKSLEVYLGGENLGNFTQQNPIIAANAPFSSSFDATNIWGPIFGRMFYAGLRFKIPK